MKKCSLRAVSVRVLISLPVRNPSDKPDKAPHRIHTASTASTRAPRVATVCRAAFRGRGGIGDAAADVITVAVTAAAGATAATAIAATSSSAPVAAGTVAHDGGSATVGYDCVRDDRVPPGRRRQQNATRHSGTAQTAHASGRGQQQRRQGGRARRARRSDRSARAGRGKGRRRHATATQGAASGDLVLSLPNSRKYLRSDALGSQRHACCVGTA